MKEGRYILKIDDDGEDVTVEIIGGITDDEIVQVFGFCTSRLIEQGADAEELKLAIDTVKGNITQEVEIE